LKARFYFIQRTLLRLRAPPDADISEHPLLSVAEYNRGAWPAPLLTSAALVLHVRARVFVCRVSCCGCRVRRAQTRRGSGASSLSAW
jgi:hypothetical protein